MAKKGSSNSFLSSIYKHSISQTTSLCIKHYLVIQRPLRQFSCSSFREKQIQQWVSDYLVLDGLLLLQTHLLGLSMFRRSNSLSTLETPRRRRGS
ncbi:hypothetical protein O6P43_002062 [Quillaja saponaria]|uniref:Uncharacterized protein n=1 Tax=Quillaja saponaria TaxID=32244 RepID=A0AAD7QBP4_QUISA|nr:hypothetical protein O6P43_002062 [Quillaja saponaria]